MPDRSELNPAVLVKNLPANQYNVVRESGEWGFREKYTVKGIRRVIVFSDAVQVFDSNGNLVGFTSTTSECDFMLPDIDVEVLIRP